MTAQSASRNPLTAANPRSIQRDPSKHSHDHITEDDETRGLAMGAWFCMVCDATGESEKFDRDAEKHTKATGHGTVTSHRDPVPLAQCIAEVREQLEARRG